MPLRMKEHDSHILHGGHSADNPQQVVDLRASGLMHSKIRGGTFNTASKSHCDSCGDFIDKQRYSKHTDNILLPQSSLEYQDMLRTPEYNFKVHNARDKERQGRETCTCAMKSRYPHRSRLDILNKSPNRRDIISHNKYGSNIMKMNHSVHQDTSQFSGRDPRGKGGDLYDATYLRDDSFTIRKRTTSYPYQDERQRDPDRSPDRPQLRNCRYVSDSAPQDDRKFDFVSMNEYQQFRRPWHDRNLPVFVENRTDYPEPCHCNRHEIDHDDHFHDKRCDHKQRILNNLNQMTQVPHSYGRNGHYYSNNDDNHLERPLVSCSHIPNKNCSYQRSPSPRFQRSARQRKEGNNIYYSELCRQNEIDVNEPMYLSSFNPDYHLRNRRHRLETDHQRSCLHRSNNSRFSSSRLPHTNDFFPKAQMNGPSAQTCKFLSPALRINSDRSHLQNIRSSYSPKYHHAKQAPSNEQNEFLCDSPNKSRHSYVRNRSKRCVACDCAFKSHS